MSEKDVVFGKLAHLLGGQNVKIVHDGNSSIEERFYGIMVEKRDKNNWITKTYIIWLLSDFEGNAPGGFSIEEQ